METTEVVARHPNPLRRSPTDRWIGGVCGGIASWLGWSPLTVRILFIAGTLLSAGLPGVLGYLVLWIVMPREPVGA